MSRPYGSARGQPAENCYNAVSSLQHYLQEGRQEDLQLFAFQCCAVVSENSR